LPKPKILVFAPLSGTEHLIDELANHSYEIVFGDAAWQKPGGDHIDAFTSAAANAVAMLGTSIRATPITRQVLTASPNLRIVAKYSVGVDDVDLDAATELGILSCHAPTEDNCFAVAENTVALMLALLKKIGKRDADLRAGKWRGMEHAATFLGTRESDGYPGITIGLIGLGRIGTRVSQLLAPWRVRLIGYDPYVAPMAFLLSGVKSVDYEVLLRESDVVSFHVPLTAGTYHMLGAAEINKMKATAIILNTARGKIVDDVALASAIENKRLGGAALDVFEEEPLSTDSPLHNLDHRLLLSPHAAAYSGTEELRQGAEWAIRSITLALRGAVPDNVYNKEAISRWKTRFGGVDLSRFPMVSGN
jgi:D-3-phosphoglycerate dehydrogenase / 2-oxoglutarate reductase